MVINVIKEGNKLTIAPVGRIDSITSSELENKINASLDENVSELDLNLKDVDFISSKGIRVILALHRRLSDNKGKLILLNPNNSIREILKLSALLDVFNIQ